MDPQDRKQPLYRKVNTTAHGGRHNRGGDHSDDRQRVAKGDELRLPMHGRGDRGLDYTPLYRFLLSRAGQPWVEVRAQAVRRLDRADPIDWMVAPSLGEGRRVVRTGESSYFSGMYVDEDGVLRVVDPTVDETTLLPSCGCCTHTFNGKPYTRKFGDWGEGD